MFSVNENVLQVLVSSKCCYRGLRENIFHSIGSVQYGDS